ncbi:MAG TPA: hypothetical protein VMU51_37120 [Mycobacteriales bacterium]|nr:hypothetical protein [Mycobacteriales bacterium]
MTILGLVWPDTSGTDVHLVPGLASPEFFRLAWGLEQSGVDVIRRHVFSMDVTVAFSTTLVGGAGAHGLRIDAKTGEVAVLTPALAGRSFLLGLTVTDRVGTGTGSATSRIRIHVHAAIDRLWLTPAPLTIRRGSMAARYSVLARFTDGVIADITNWSPFESRAGDTDHTYVHADGSHDPALTWSVEPPANGLAVDPQTGILSVPADSGQGRITVRFGTKSDTATLRFAPPWSTPVTVERRAGPGAVAFKLIPNILFLPDGFADNTADKEAFDRIVRLIVTRLTTRHRSRPYQAFGLDINYWSAWVPSPAAGVTVLPELNPDFTTQNPADGSQHAVEVPLPSGTIARASWRLEDMIEGVGLPTPVDSENNDLTAKRINDWAAIYPGVSRPRVAAAFPAWTGLKSRAVVDEQNTAFHMAFGERPTVDQQLVAHALTLNHRRVSDADFNAFLGALQAIVKRPDGTPVPVAMKDDAGKPIWVTGKDRALVVVICRSSHVGGVNSFRETGVDGARTLGVALAARQFHQVLVDQAGETFVQADSIPTDVFYDMWLTAAHELGHAFGLGDEYANRSSPATAAEIATAANRSPNVQHISTLTTGGVLDAKKIKWANWPRIARAGVLADTVVPIAGQPNRFTVHLRDAVASKLRPTDVARFRKWPLVTAGAASPRFTVDTIEIRTNQVTLTKIEADPFDPTAFPGGSVLMVPVRAPVKDGKLGADRPLADPTVLQRITDTGNPLNADPNSPHNLPPLNAVVPAPTKATNFPGGNAPKPPPLSSWIVGLYDNGSTRTKGFYHPTGICLMIQNADDAGGKRPTTLYDFCIVCHYALVDQVNPTLHNTVEDEFIERFGKQGAI